MMRFFISEAALLVKVIAMISSGASTVLRSLRYRCVKSSVFPAPAGASTMNELNARAISRLAVSWANSACSVMPRPSLWRLQSPDDAQTGAVAQRA